MNYKQILTMSLAVIFMSCGASNTANINDTSLSESLEKKNRLALSLLDQIRKIPGIALRNGVPVFTKNTSTFGVGVPFEPLYVLDDYIVGNSFRNLDQLVQNVNIDKIEVFTDTDASFYGSRAANGVIKITTLK